MMCGFWACGGLASLYASIESTPTGPRRLHSPRLCPLLVQPCHCCVHTPTGCWTRRPSHSSCRIPAHPPMLPHSFRPPPSPQDIDYINDRNAHFNRKIERIFGEHTAEIKANLERGELGRGSLWEMRAGEAAQEAARSAAGSMHTCLRGVGHHGAAQLWPGAACTVEELGQACCPSALLCSPQI